MLSKPSFDTSLGSRDFTSTVMSSRRLISRRTRCGSAMQAHVTGSGACAAALSRVPPAMSPASPRSSGGLILARRWHEPARSLRMASSPHVRIGVDLPVSCVEATHLPSRAVVAIAAQRFVRFHCFGAAPAAGIAKLRRRGLRRAMPPVQADIQRRPRHAQQPKFRPKAACVNLGSRVE